MPIPKPTKDEQAYWEKVLREHGLSMERGRANRVSQAAGKTDWRRRLVYAGDSKDLEKIDQATSTDGRRVTPPGQRPD